MRAFTIGTLVLIVTMAVSPAALASYRDQQDVGQDAPAQPTGVDTPRAPTLGRGNPDAFEVPWQFLKPGAAQPKTPLTLYWFPASQEEIQRSDLLSSRELSYEASECVGMRGVLPDDLATIDKFGVEDKRPVVLLVDSDGKILNRVDNAKGKLRVARVEKMLKDEIGAVDDGIYDQFMTARKKSEGGDKKAAIAIYRKIWSQRCLFPEAAREAKRALGQLGVTVEDAPKPDKTPHSTGKEIGPGSERPTSRDRRPQKFLR